jgi:5-methylcytosine-specific restriction endonuclease McrA
MPNKTMNPKLLWIQFEDVLAPRLGLNVWDRAVYSYLLRHSLVIGKPRLHFAVLPVARDLGISTGPVRLAIRRLDELGALRILERSKSGHLVEMRLPEQIRALRPAKGDVLARHSSHATRHFRNGAFHHKGESRAALEASDFLSSAALRKSIHDREAGICFYCRRRTPVYIRCIDHVVPRACSGRNGYRNLVSCCVECNSRKCDRPAPDFLRTLYRQGRLTPAELDARLRALKGLAAGKLRPSLP